MDRAGVQAQLHRPETATAPRAALLGIGCGWGGLIMPAAQHYGVEATGIRLSAHILVAGLADQCCVLVRDYWEVDQPGDYDALASMGMFEHVSGALLPAYFSQAWKLLKPRGIFLNHGIANRALTPLQKGWSFSDMYVFQDGELAPISTSLRAAEEAGFEVRDVEGLREHYALVLRNWVRCLESQHERACNTWTTRRTGCGGYLCPVRRMASALAG